jgi:hypothetical protein
MRLAVVFLLLAGCSSAPVEPPDSEAASLPLLAPGLTLGTSLYGGGVPADLEAGPLATLESAADRGLGGFTVYVEWADLEPEPGRYTLDGLAATLDDLDRLGFVPFVNVTVGDSDGLSLPPGVPDAGALDDPEVTDRFGRLLDRLVPLLLDHDGFFLGLGNEMGEVLDGDRDAREAYARFLEAARVHAHGIEPRLAVGVTLTVGAIRNRTPTYRTMRPVSDVVAFNHGPIRPDFFVLDIDEIADDFREVLAAAGDGPVLIQELTCPNAASMGASDTWQADCFRELIGVLDETPRVRFAAVFTYLDFDEPTCELIQDALLESDLGDLPPDVAQRLRDYFCALGVVDVDGTPSPAWEVIVEAAEARR